MLTQTPSALPTVIVHGPQGSGKTTYAERLMAAFGCTEVRDGWTPEEPIYPGALHLTQTPPPFALPSGVALYSIQEAKAFAEGHGFHA